ncbi:uncharacterized protein PIG-H [Eurosta solidaginis]|uniref:uncharacterized protein PIG-H n=1 Tax=Eurosta solidaginis TaxID=178769 RepID=UPI0035308A1F
MSQTSPPERSKKVCLCHSRGQLYDGNETPDLQLTLSEYGQDAIEIELTNMQYSSQKRQKIKHIILFLFVWIAYTISTSSREVWFSKHALCDISFILWILYRLINLFSLIQSERVIFCLDLALQCHTVRFLQRSSNLLIPVNNIYDIVINEVIENLDVHYILIIRTQGELFQKKPIISIFNTLHPSFECLQKIYICLNKRMPNSNAPS